MDKNAVVSASDLCAAFRNHLTHTVGKSCETLAEGFGLAFDIAAQFDFLSLYLIPKCGGVCGDGAATGGAGEFTK
jgi:hypothetical protein